jgi:CBS domain-containing protein
MNVSDVMTKSVRRIAPDDDVLTAACIMVEAGLSGLPVVDEAGRVVGMLTEGDLIRRKELGTLKRRSWWLELFSSSDDLAREYVKSRSLKVRDVMTTTVVSVEEDTELSDLVALLQDQDIKRVPVLRQGELVGIVSRADLVRWLALQQTPSRPQPGDAAIRNTLLQRLRSRSWLPTAGMSFLVANGTVSLFGVAGSEEQRRALIVMAETTPGVKNVRDELKVHAI